jgi:cell division protein FtsB
MAQSHTAQHGAPRRRSQSEYLPVAMRVVSSLIVLCALLTAGFTFYPEWVRLSDMKRELAKQKDRMEDLRNLSQAREKEIHLLETDREYLEMIARDRLDLMKEGETIFRFGTGQHKS